MSTPQQQIESETLVRQSTTDTGLAVIEQYGELQASAAAAKEQHEIQSAILIAKRFPRNEDQAFEKLMKACARPTFAEDAGYSFPRGNKFNEETGRWEKNYVTGPSVNLAREAARVWQNIRYGLDVIREDGKSRLIRGWAWDVETNVKVSADDEFQKLIQRKQKGGQTQWVVPDERDLRELTNRRGAILIRNSILQLLPRDLIEDAQEKAKATVKDAAAKDPDAARKKLILSFSELNVTPEMLEAKLGHKLVECSPTEIADLRNIYRSIRDGNSTWAEYVATTEDANGAGAKPKGKTLDDLTEELKAEAAQTSEAPATETTATETQQVTTTETATETQAETPGTVDGPPPWKTPRAEYPKKVDDKDPLGEIKTHLQACKTVPDVTRVRNFALGPESKLSDLEKGAATTLCDERAAEIRKARGKKD
jgi:hypothetical protein